MSKTLNKACPIQFRFSPVGEMPRMRRRCGGGRTSHKEQHNERENCTRGHLLFRNRYNIYKSVRPSMIKWEVFENEETFRPTKHLSSKTPLAGLMSPSENRSHCPRRAVQCRSICLLDGPSPRPTCPAHKLCTQMSGGDRDRDGLFCARGEGAREVVFAFE